METGEQHISLLPVPWPKQVPSGFSYLIVIANNIRGKLWQTFVGHLRLDAS